MEINESDFPALFNAADQASRVAQNKYLLFIKWTVGLTIAAAVAGAFSVESSTVKAVSAWASFVILIVSTFLTIYLRQESFEKDWYDGRAVAESVKTRAWRYMVRSDPYGEALSVADASLEFIKIIEEIIRSRQAFVNKIQSFGPSTEQITDKMRLVRSLPFEERKSIYLEKRIEDQRSWYEKKSIENKNQASFWTNVIFTLQVIGIVLSIIAINFPEFPINFLGIATTLISSAIAWLQLKRHQDLYNSYGVAATELGLIKQRAREMNDPTQFSLFVSDAENAISREHTLWAARRDAT